MEYKEKVTARDEEEVVPLKETREGGRLNLERNTSGWTDGERCEGR